MYSLHYLKENITVFERDPNRVMIIQNPDEYSAKAIRGLLKTPKNLWQTSEQVFIINGYLFKKDHNFVDEFKIDEIEGYNIFVGPHPQQEHDIKVLAEHGITDVLCLQTKDDFISKEVNFYKLNEYYQENEIRLTHNPITDFDEEDLKVKLRAASGIVSNILEKGNSKIYVHCTAGMTRSTSTIITYLCLYHGFSIGSA